MSRSYRKPYTPNNEGSGHWKKKANRKIRRDKECELIDGNHFKRINNRWDSPMEQAGGWWDVPRMRRK